MTTQKARIEPNQETKVQSVHRRLSELAHQSGPDAKLPTVSELCLSFGTSRSTINDALEQLEAQEVIRRRRGSGIFVSPKITNRSIALLFRVDFFRERVASPFWDILWSKFILAAQARSEIRSDSFTVHILHAKDGRLQALDDHLTRLIETGRISGVLGVGLELETVEWIRGQGVPVIGFAGLGQWHVVISGEEIVRLAAKHLIERGCKRPRLWIAGHYVHIVDWRNPAIKQEASLDRDVEAFREVLEASHLPFQADRVWSYAQQMDPPLLQEQGAWAAERLLNEGLAEETDGLILTNDLMALGAMKVLQRSAAGRKIQVATHANKGAATLYAFDDVLTQVLVDPEEIVRAMFQLLDAVMAGKQPEKDFVTIGPSSLTLPMKASR
ncbi:hypothetical protein CCAX7_25290 [Capsulimonas corticalis]|uniref:Uncharacterized protein n=1 Tax=Capsulimonas corticalis TaxID=2219043 RepID=A0A402CVP7_9BACT|nr:GntR family transcriptional regulator [Capsulimonas corticalis]BDI30478.1 hypothetical protein CCAX7_25290 [Capsulimonas corticalis]